MSEGMLATGWVKTSEIIPTSQHRIPFVELGLLDFVLNPFFLDFSLF
jgi:hypothetical protein